MSVFGSLQAACQVWGQVCEACKRRGQAVKLGDFIAEVELQPECGISLEDLCEPDEHLTIWGDPATLASAVCRTYSPHIEEE